MHHGNDPLDPVHSKEDVVFAGNLLEELSAMSWIFVSVISERSLNTFRPPSAMMEFQWVTSVKLIHCKTWFTLASAATAAISDSILSQFLPLSVPPSVNLTQLHAKIYQEQGLVNVVSLTS